MKTTLIIPDPVFRDLKRRAAERNETLSALVTEYLIQGMRDARKPKRRFRFRTFKMGSTIPVKFTASCGGSSVLTGVHRLQVVKYSDSTTAGTAIDATPQDAATAGNEFHLADGQWQFNLDTKVTGMSVGIWKLVATLSDGSQHTTWIQLK